MPEIKTGDSGPPCPRCGGPRQWYVSPGGAKSARCRPCAHDSARRSHAKRRPRKPRSKPKPAVVSQKPRVPSSPDPAGQRERIKASTSSNASRRQDGKQLSDVPCARCGERIPLLAAKAGDKWCSTVCCRLAHGLPVPGGSELAGAAL